MKSCQCIGIEREFNAEDAENELAAYREQGPSKTTQILIDALTEQGVEGRTLLDIGGGDRRDQARPRLGDLVSGLLDHGLGGDGRRHLDRRPGAIAGFVSNAITGAAIGGASVTISGFANPFLTGVNGEFYVLDVTAGTYTVTASATGHQSRTRNNVVVFEGSFQDVSLPLTPDGAPFRWGEVSGDGLVGTIDASLILQWVVGLIGALPIEPGTVYPAYPEAADVTGDAVLGTLDASAILQWKVRLIPNFVADTDGDDFGPEAIKRAAAKILPQTDAPARVWLEALNRADGALTVNVAVEDAKDLSGYALSISYDASALTLAGVARAPHGWIGPAYYEDNGVVYVTSAGSEPVYEKAILAELVFLPNSPDAALSDAARSIRIEAVLLNDGQHPVLIEHAESADEEAQND